MWSLRKSKLLGILSVGILAGTLIGQTMAGYITQSSTWLVNSLIDSTPIGSTYPSTGVFYSLVSDNNIFAYGTLSANGGLVGLTTGTSGGCNTSSSAGNTCTSTVNWSASFSNTSYTPVCTVISPTGFPWIIGMSKANGSVTVTITNGQGNQAIVSGGTLNCVAYKQ